MKLNHLIRPMRKLNHVKDLKTLKFTMNKMGYDANLADIQEAYRELSRTHGKDWMEMKNWLSLQWVVADLIKKGYLV